MLVHVKMLVSTRKAGVPVLEGEVIEVDEVTAGRWIGNGIAELDKESDETPYSNMKPKALFKLCTDRGIEVEEKQPAEYYVEKLIQADNEEEI